MEAKAQPVDSKTATTQVLMLGVQKEIILACIEVVCGQALTGTKAHTRIEDWDVELSPLVGDPRLNPGWLEAIRDAHAAVILVRHLDLASLDKIKAIYRRLPQETIRPLSIGLFREEGELDFKMSCPACGQKLWVRDSDVGKQGRCPKCKWAFALPSQAAHVKTHLTLPETVPVISVLKSSP
ncbi:MAG: hypothetical protein K9N49_01535, partial [Candidatus Marinimicrobia bacterium]|nr:hypothetical protein [Candidatus Neomarinimicrobiota bacterium]